MKEWLLVIVVFLLVFSGGIFAVIQPYYEMKSFNKFTTGQKANYFDAVFSKLRITSE